MQKIKLWEDTKKTADSSYLNLRMAKVECEYGGAFILFCSLPYIQ